MNKCSSSQEMRKAERHVRKNAVIRQKAEMFQERADNATDPVSRQHYKEMAAHYRQASREHLDVRHDEPAH